MERNQNTKISGAFYEKLVTSKTNFMRTHKNIWFYHEKEVGIWKNENWGIAVLKKYSQRHAMGIVIYKYNSNLWIFYNPESNPSWFNPDYIEKDLLKRTPLYVQKKAKYFWKIRRIL